MPAARYIYRPGDVDADGVPIPRLVDLSGYAERLLRERDGDACQLCFEPIDFVSRATRKNPSLGRSIDHIIPKTLRGTDDLTNLWLTHFKCNARKGKQWIGRQDGSIDPRRVDAGPGTGLADERAAHSCAPSTEPLFVPGPGDWIDPVTNASGDTSES